MTELYKLTCFKCGETVELPTVLRRCTKCGAEFTIDWDGERREYATNPIFPHFGFDNARTGLASGHGQRAAENRYTLAHAIESKGDRWVEKAQCKPGDRREPEFLNPRN